MHNFQQTFQDFSKWSKNNAAMEPLMEMQKLNSAANEQFVRETIAFCSDNTGTMVKSMQANNRSLRPEDLLKSQFALTAEYMENGFQYLQNVLKIAHDSMDAYREWAEDKMTTAIKDTEHKTKKTSVQ